jgi:glucan phosphoethanolaminetransferase (alkaline phosphatase superfamily)
MAGTNPRYPMDVMNIRPWIFFYLICFVAILLAATFIVQGITTLFWVSSTLIITVVGFNFILIFQEVRDHNRKKAMMKNFSQNYRKKNEPDQP